MTKHYVVYFLISDNEVVYVGKSEGLKYRIDWHLREFYKFDRVLFLCVGRDDVIEVEQFWIDKLKPIYNTRGTGRKFGHRQRLRQQAREGNHG